MKPFVLITGPPAAGKTTVAKRLCCAFQKSAYVSVDSVRHMIQNGFEQPSNHSREASSQVFLGARNACMLTKSFYKNGFVSVIDDVVISKNLLDYYFKQLGKNRLAVFVLLPNLKELKKRDAKRTKSLRMGKRVAELFQEYQNRKSEKRWRIIDSSDLKPKQTIQRLLAELKNP